MAWLVYPNDCVFRDRLQILLLLVSEFKGIG